MKDLRDGLIRINQKSVSKCANTTVDDWFTQDPSKIMAKMKIIAQFCKHQLGISYIYNQFLTKFPVLPMLHSV